MKKYHTILEDNYISLQELLDAVKEAGITEDQYSEVELEADCRHEYGDTFYHIQATILREETDEEREAREEQERKRQEQIEAQQRQDYERLKEKFGD